MYLCSARPRLAILPTTLLLRILEYTVAAEWSSIIRLAGVNRRFRKIIHEYVWPEIRELCVFRASMYVEDFDEIYINGSFMGGLKTLLDNQQNLFFFDPLPRPSQKFKDFLSYFLSMAENLECIELNQTTDPYPAQQGLHHLFDHLRSGIILNACSVKKIVLRFTVNTFHSAAFRRFINSGTAPLTLRLDNFEMLDINGGQLLHVTDLTCTHFRNPYTWQYSTSVWRSLFGRLPELRRLTTAYRWSYQHLTDLTVQCILRMRSMFTAFQNAYEGKKSRIDFYFEIEKGSDYRSLVKKMKILNFDKVVYRECDCVIYIDKKDVEIRIYCTERMVRF